MNRSVLRRGRSLALATVLALVPAASAVAAPVNGPTPADAVSARVTAADVAASNEKARMAYGALVPMWEAHFESLGERFAAPRHARFNGPGVRTACGAVTANNAAYCPRTNTIYYDELFLAAMAKRAASQLGTDGDMAAVGVIAHEMGHAVAIQLGNMSRYTYENEKTADCLAGAFARQAEADGSLEDGDLDEALYGMAAAGDPTPQPTGNPRYDARVVRMVRLMGHGTREQRMANFKAGYDGGAGACLASFQ
jgi:predicted metalloprotease